jgi:hypothetical protein
MRLISWTLQSGSEHLLSHCLNVWVRLHSVQKRGWTNDQAPVDLHLHLDLQHT